jgi:hypothetical protein
MKIHFLRCHVCGCTFAGEEKTRSALRKRARESGWIVGSPLWMTASPAVTKETYWATHPDSKGKTVDECPDCFIVNQRKALRSVGKSLTDASLPPTRIILTLRSSARFSSRSLVTGFHESSTPNESRYNFQGVQNTYLSTSGNFQKFEPEMLTVNFRNLVLVPEVHY